MIWKKINFYVGEIKGLQIILNYFLSIDWRVNFFLLPHPVQESKVIKNIFIFFSSFLNFITDTEPAFTARNALFNVKILIQVTRASL